MLMMRPSSATQVKLLLTHNTSGSLQGFINPLGEINTGLSKHLIKAIKIRLQDMLSGAEQKCCGVVCYACPAANGGG